MRPLPRPVYPLLALAFALACGDAERTPPKAQPAAPEPSAELDDFPRLGPPPPGGWRTRVEEPGQSFADYQASEPNRPLAPRTRLYLQPLAPYPSKVVLPGDLPSLQLEEQGFVSFVFSPAPDQLAEFLGAFYGLDAHVLPAQALPEAGRIPARVHGKHAQYDARALLEQFGPTLPEDAYSMTLLVARDLVVSDAQEFAFGYGLHHERLAVASFAQLDPQFGGRSRAPDFQQRIRARCHKLLAHEVGHTLGMEHCDTYTCVMNGVAHLPELDATPLHLCPICQRKLAWLVGEEALVGREQALARYYERAGLSTPE